MAGDWGDAEGICGRDLQWLPQLHGPGGVGAPQSPLAEGGAMWFFAFWVGLGGIFGLGFFFFSQKNLKKKPRKM